MEMPFKMADIESEDSFVDCAQHNVVLVNALAKEFKGYLVKSKITKPFGSLKKWLKGYVANFDWNTQNYDILLQWVVALSLFVEDFAPPAFVQEGNSLLIPDLITNVLLPKVNTGQNVQPNVNNGQNVQQDMPNGRNVQQDMQNLQLPQVNHAQNVQQAMHNVPNVAAPSVTCSNCAAHLLPGCLHCGDCGTKSSAFSTGYSFCGDCGQQAVGPGKVFCSNCGSQAPAPAMVNGHRPAPKHADAMADLVADLQHKLQLKDQMLTRMATGATGLQPHDAAALPTGNLPNGEWQQQIAMLQEQVRSRDRILEQLATTGSMGKHTSGASTSGAYAGHDALPAKQKGMFPSFTYDPVNRRLINDDQPRACPSYPTSYTPQPTLANWQPKSTMHDSARFRIRQMQAILGHMYSAIAAHDECKWPKEGVGVATNWADLSQFQVALALVESSLEYTAWTQECGFSGEETQYQMGIGSPPFASKKLEEAKKMVQRERKYTAHERPTDTKKGDKRGDSSTNPRIPGTCWSCGADGHMSSQCPQKKSARVASEEALRARTEQIAAARVEAGNPSNGQGGGH